MTLLPEAPSNNNDEPLYNIGVVTRMTAISMATLRAWERRYNFPEARRTSGGHRLYSERDIMRLRWVKDRIAEGMQTARAISALVHQEETGQFSAAASPAILQPAAPAGDRNTALQVYHLPLVNALIHRELVNADTLLNEALVSASPDEIILDLIGPTLAAVGKAWEDHQISVATEHLATNFLRQRLLMWMVSGPPAQAKPPIILACGPNEWHEGSLLMLGAILRRRRWPIAYLGQAVPFQDLAVFVREMNPSVVVLVAMTEATASELIEWPKWLADIHQAGKPPVGFGGRIFSLYPEWQKRMPGIYLGSTLRQGVEVLEKILSRT